MFQVKLFGFPLIEIVRDRKPQKTNGVQYNSCLFQEIVSESKTEDSVVVKKYFTQEERTKLIKEIAKESYQSESVVELILNLNYEYLTRGGF